MFKKHVHAPQQDDTARDGP